MLRDFSMFVRYTSFLVRRIRLWGYARKIWNDACVNGDHWTCFECKVNFRKRNIYILEFVERIWLIQRFVFFLVPHWCMQWTICMYGWMYDNENGSKHDVFEIKVCFVMLILRNGMSLFLNYIERVHLVRVRWYIVIYLFWCLFGSFFFFLIHWIRLNDQTMACLIDWIRFRWNVVCKSFTCDI